MRKQASSFLCRVWLCQLAEELGVSAGLRDPQVLASTAAEAARMAERLLKLPPWHFRFLLGLIESTASLWCVVYRVAGLKNHRLAEELQAFEKVPIIAAPLLKLYRSLVAMSWFELPEVTASLGLSQTHERLR